MRLLLRAAWLVYAAAANVVTLVAAGLFFFPFLVPASVTALLHPGGASFAALALWTVSAALLFGIAQMWGSRQASFRFLHDFLFRYRTLPVREHAPDDYLQRYDPDILPALYQPPDLRKPPERRTHRIHVVVCEGQDDVAPRDPLAYVNPAALGASYVTLRMAPDDVEGVGWFTVLHELGHARPHRSPIYMHRLLGMAPHRLAVAWALCTFSPGWGAAFALAVLLWTTRRLGQALAALRLAGRVFEEIAADCWAVEHLHHAERERLQAMLDRNPGMLDDATLPAAGREHRAAALRLNLRRAAVGIPPLRAEWWRFHPWWVMAPGVAALAVLAVSARPPTGANAVLPAALVCTGAAAALALVLRSHRHLEDAVERDVRLTRAVAGMRAIVEETLPEPSMPDSMRLRHEEAKRLEDDHVYDEDAISMVLDMLSRFGPPVLGGFRIARWVRLPETTVRREFEAMAWAAGDSELRSVRLGLAGAMHVERRPHRIARLARVRAWFELAVGRHQKRELLDELAGGTGFPDEVYRAAREQVGQVLSTPAASLPALVAAICDGGEREASVFRTMLAATASHADEQTREHLAEALTCVFVMEKMGVPAVPDATAGAAARAAARASA